MPIPNGRPEVVDVFKHVAGIDSVDAVVREWQLFSIIPGVIHVHAERMRQHGDCIRGGAAIPDIDRDFTGQVGGKEAIAQPFIEGAA